MTNYADYAYYTDTYGGAVIDTASFDLYAARATQTIKLYTFNRIADDNIPDEAKMCCCELAELIFRHETESGKGSVASEKVGGYSVTYADSEKLKATFNADTKSIMFKWLAMTDLLYRGCY